MVRLRVMDSFGVMVSVRVGIINPNPNTNHYPEAIHNSKSNHNLTLTL